MRLFKRQARHIGLQELSDLIDAQLAGHRKEQVEAHLKSCDPCREDLEGLRYSVDLLHQAPMLAPRRRLVMQEAPTPAVARPIMESWAYGAPASVAVLLAVVLGADLMGALPGGRVDFAAEESALSDAPFESEVAMETDLIGVLPGGGVDFAAEESAFSDVPFENEVALEAAVAESDGAGIQDEPLMEAQVAAKSLAEEADEAMEDESAHVATSARSVTDVPADAEGDERTPDAATATGSVTDVPAEPEGNEVTHVFWRALEGVLAASLALLLGVVLWRILRSRRSTP